MWSWDGDDLSIVGRTLLDSLFRMYKETEPDLSPLRRNSPTLPRLARGPVRQGTRPETTPRVRPLPQTGTQGSPRPRHRSPVSTRVDKGFTVSRLLGGGGDVETAGRQWHTPGKTPGYWESHCPVSGSGRTERLRPLYTTEEFPEPPVVLDSSKQMSGRGALRDASPSTSIPSRTEGYFVTLKEY